MPQRPPVASLAPISHIRRVEESVSQQGRVSPRAEASEIGKISLEQQIGVFRENPNECEGRDEADGIGESQGERGICSIPHVSDG